MVEARALGPGGEGFFALAGEDLGEFGIVLAGEGISGGDDAALAGIDAVEFHGTDSEFQDGSGEAVELVFPEGGDTADFEIGADANAHLVGGDAGEPACDFDEGRSADDRGAGGIGVVGKTGGGVFFEMDGEVEEFIEPVFQTSAIVIDVE